MSRAGAWVIGAALLLGVAACGGDPVDQPLQGQAAGSSNGGQQGGSQNANGGSQHGGSQQGGGQTNSSQGGNGGSQQGGNGGSQQGGGTPVAAEPPTLVVSPIDVAHVTAISKFRSCAAHDFSPNVRGHGEPGSEGARSMKHYLQTDVPVDQPDSLPVYAPIDGTVEIQEEQFPLGKQVYLHADGWSLRIFHVDPTVENGATVKAGDLIGNLPPVNADELLGKVRDQNGKAGPYEFDIALTSDDNRQYVSILDAMSPDVAAQWAARGFTPEAAIITREARDAAPCTLGDDGERFADQSYHPDDWVQAAG